MKTALSTMFTVAFLVTTASAGHALSGGDTERITAQVIDLSCLVVHDLSGEDHRECAEVCADQGVPLAFLAEDGTIYHPVSMEMPSSGDEINEKLRPHAEQMVEVEGELVDRGGTQGIIIDEVTAASQ